MTTDHDFAARLRAFHDAFPDSPDPAAHRRHVMAARAWLAALRVERGRGLTGAEMSLYLDGPPSPNPDY